MLFAFAANSSAQCYTPNITASGFHSNKKLVWDITVNEPNPNATYRIQWDDNSAFANPGEQTCSKISLCTTRTGGVGSNLFIFGLSPTWTSPSQTGYGIGDHWYVRIQVIMPGGGECPWSAPIQVGNFH